jgi:molybdate transport system substrate-binding protein
MCLKMSFSGLIRKWFGVFALTAMCGLGVRAAEITVFAAASLTDALTQIGTAYEKKTGDKVVFNFGASSTLARQIQEGAPADIFFSADEAKMDDLEEKNIIIPNTRSSRLGNTLVIVVPKDAGAVIVSPQDLTNSNVKRIALADTKAVPAGIYAKEYLGKLKLWTAVEPKVVPTENVRAALAAVESGNVEAGIVYKTDAAISKKIKVAFEVPRAQGPSITYPLAIIRESHQSEAARGFLNYINSDEAGQIFAASGFIVLK